MQDLERPRARNRVVMLVDNAIDGDSRVQKTAKAMAEAGWEVHLVGSAARASGDQYELGGATVYRRTLKMPPTPQNLRQRLAGLRFPLSHANVTVADRHWERRRIMRSDVAQRNLAASLRAEGRPRLDRFRMPLAIHRFLVRAKVRWLRVRLEQTRAAAAWQRARADGWPERIETFFWRALLGDRAWRRLDPSVLQWELAYESVIDRIRPDLVHAHDFRMIGVAARAVARARAEGRDVRLVYDAHEFLPGVAHPNRKWLTSHVGYEREYLPFADAIVTVSPRLADLLAEHHGLAERPAVVLNVPPRPDRSHEGWATFEGARDVRAACGLAPDTPLMVYCGGAAAARGLHTMIESLRLVPGLHAAFVINRLNGNYLDSLRKRVERGGLADRVHFMPYVPYDLLPGFLSTADVGVHPLRTGLVNHEAALSTKFFEYMHAGLPLVVSDVKLMSEEVRRLGVGESFRCEDPRDLARAVSAVLADPGRYTKPYAEPGFLDEYTWEAQAVRYDEIYRRLLLPGAQRGAGADGVSGGVRQQSSPTGTGTGPTFA